MIRAMTVFFSIILLTGSGYASDETGAIPLSVHSTSRSNEKDELLNPTHPVWSQAKEQPLHFHRTPPLYADGPFDDGARPKAVVQFVRIDSGELLIKLEWDDPTENLFQQGKRFPDGGESHIYKTHTSLTDAFGDAACLMIPTSRKPVKSYPSMMMGDLANPVDLFYWQAGRGFSLLNAHGRASTAAANIEVKGKSIRTSKGWAIIFVLPEAVDSVPISFAIWEGSKKHRDGLKYFSLWYEIKL